MSRSAKPSTARTNLEHRIVGTEADGGRVSDVFGLFPRILLREDARVQAAYRTWHARAEHPTPDLVIYIVAEMRSAAALVDNLHLSEYRSWLPKALLEEFSATATGGQVEYSLPRDLKWKARGVAPKHGPKQREHMERNLTWLYRRHVKSPPVSKRSLQREDGSPRGTRFKRDRTRAIVSRVH
jgi:hypothetical protein